MSTIDFLRGTLPTSQLDGAGSTAVTPAQPIRVVVDPVVHQVVHSAAAAAGAGAGPAAVSSDSQSSTATSWTSATAAGGAAMPPSTQAIAAVALPIITDSAGGWWDEEGYYYGSNGERIGVAGDIDTPENSCSPTPSASAPPRGWDTLGILPPPTPGRDCLGVLRDVPSKVSARGTPFLLPLPAPAGIPAAHGAPLTPTGRSLLVMPRRGGSPRTPVASAAPHNTGGATPSGLPGVPAPRTPTSGGGSARSVNPPALYLDGPASIRVRTKTKPPKQVLDCCVIL